jgi:ATP-dependent Lhr-like helicase
LGSEDGRVAFYLTDRFASLAPPPTPAEGELEEKVRAILRPGRAIFFDELAREIGGFRNDLTDALWRMVWGGEVTNDTLMPLRSLRQQKQTPRRMS